MSPIVAAFVRSTLLPSIAFGLALLGTGGVGEPARGRLQALALALLYAFGAYMLLDRIAFPPSDVSDSLSYVALLFALFALIAPKAHGARYVLRAVFTVAAGALLLYHIRGPIAASPTGHRNLLAFFCLALGVWSIAERSARSVAPATYAVIGLVATTGTSLILLFGASASFAQLVGVLAGLLGAFCAVALVFPRRVSVAGVQPFASVFVVFFMVAGHFYLDVNPWKMIALCWPYLVLWVRPWLPGPKAPLAEAVAFGLLAALPVAYFVYTAFQAAGPLY